MSLSRKNTVVTSLLIGFALLVASPVQAETVVRSGEVVSIAEDQLIEGDFYTAAGKVNVSGAIEQDMVAASGEVTLNGSVGEDVFLIAGQTSIHGSVGDDLRIISGETTIAEPVMGDLLVIGGSVDILSSASVAGDVILYAADATIEGSVGGNVLGQVNSLRIDAPVAGDVDVTVDQLTLGDKANITGSVRYVSSRLAVLAPNHTVTGDVLRSDPVLPGAKPTIQVAILPLFIMLFSVLVWYLISRRTLNLVVSRALVKSPRPFLLGLFTFLFAPVAFALLFVSMIGTLVGFVLGLAYVLLICLSLVAVSAVFGQLLLGFFNKADAQVNLLSLAIGVTGITICMLLPVIGQVIVLALMFMTFGAMVDLLRHPEKMTEHS